MSKSLRGRGLRLVAVPIIGVLAMLIAAAPAWGAFPGRPGPIAYAKLLPAENEYEHVGGLVAHPPRVGGSPRQLTDKPDDGGPSYSADGRMIAFESTRNAPGEAEKSGTHIFVMRSDGSGIRQLTSGEGFSDSNPSFSPNGRLVVFERYRPSTRATHIFSVRVGGGGLRQLTRGRSTDSEPSYAPNGKWIAFVSTRRRRGRNDDSNIFSMRPNGRHVRLLVGGGRRDFAPDVSPDGRHVAFASNRHSSQGANVFVRRIGRRPHVRQLTRGSSSQTHIDPSWAPDGRQIALWRKSRSIHEIVKSTYAIVVVRANGRGPTKVFAKSFSQEGCCEFIGPPGWGPRPR
jgi:Tol biopolymer transport system component